MARLPRLALPGRAHLVLHRAHGASALFTDDDDRAQALRCLRDAMAGRRVALHAYALLHDRVWLLLTPSVADELGRLLQSFGRGYTASFNRRHGGRGTVWAGRYRCTVVEPGPTLRDVLLFVEQSPVRAGIAAAAGDWPWSSAIHHLGAAHDPLITHAAEYWALGNTPFERAAVYGSLVEERLPAIRATEIAAAAEKGWAMGSRVFLTLLGHETKRPLLPRRRGRPRIRHE
jgi:putative transposase